MKKFKYILAVPLIALGFCLAGCSADNTDVRTNTGVAGTGGSTSGGDGSNNGGDGDNNGGNNGASGGGDCSSLLCMTVALRQADTSVLDDIENCSTDIQGQTCIATIPELDLRRNDIEFYLTTGDAATCEYITFDYYRYRRSLDMGYPDPAAPDATLDCTIPGGPSDGEGCWGGAWTQSDIFPVFPSLIQNTTVSTDLDVIVPASIDFFPANPFNNRFAANDLLSRGVDQPDYVGGSMEDYTVRCLDEFNELIASIVITIDEDNGPLNQVLGWD